MTKTDQQAATKAYIITYAEGKHSLIAGNLMGFKMGLFGSDAKYIEVTCFTDQELQERDEKIRRDHEILVETMLTTFKAEKELIARGAFEAGAAKRFITVVEHCNETHTVQCSRPETFEDYKKSKENER